MIVDLCTLGLVAGITYALMSEGLWGAALMFFNALFASLIAFNFYEPLAQLIINNMSAVAAAADSVSMMVLYLVSLLLLRLATESLTPSMVRFPTPLYHIGRIIFGLGGALIMVAMLVLGYQASPVQKKLLGVLDYKHVPFYTERFDRDFLAFFQYTTGYTFARNGIGDPDREFPARPLLFDPRGEWLIIHQQARPYGTDAILDDSDSGTPPPATGGAQPGGQSGTPGRGASNEKPGMGIPGGTAGAAAGLAPPGP